MSWIESQLQVLTQRVETLYRQVIDLANQIKAANQGLRASYQQPAGTTTSGGGGMYYCAPSGSIGAASGAPGAGAPGGPVSADVYKVSGGAYSLVASSADIYNPMLSATTANHVLAVADNGDGTYTAISQSCT